MALNPSNVDAVVLAAGSIILTAQANQQITFTKVTATNSDTVPVTLTVNRVPNGGSAGASNVLIDAMSIGAGATVTLPFSGKNLVNQQSLYASASVDSEIVLSMDFVTQP